MFNDDLLAATISKILRLAQGNAAKLDTVLENQAKFQETLDAQQKDILAIKAKFEPQPKEEEVKKVKGKARAHDDFYRVNIPIFYTIFNFILLIIICITGNG